MKKNNSGKQSAGNYRFLIIVLVALACAFIFNTFIVSVSRVSGRSMQPVLNENDWIVYSRLSFLSSDPVFGDIIIFSKKDVTKELLVKRVIGIPSDTVEIKSGVLYLNDAPATADFASLYGCDDMEKVTVSEGCYFVMGDNRAESNDSRIWDEPFVKRNDIVGKVFLKYFPEIEKIN